MKMLKDIIKNNDVKKLENEGIIIDKKVFLETITDFYHKLNKVYSLSGNVSKTDVYSVDFRAEAGRYFPSVEPNDVLMLADNIRVSLNQVREIKFWISDNLFLDFSLKMVDGAVVHFTAHPQSNSLQVIRTYFDFVGEVH
jgi:hypothetical protein